MEKMLKMKRKKKKLLLMTTTMKMMLILLMRKMKKIKLSYLLRKDQKNYQKLHYSEEEMKMMIF